MKWLTKPGGSFLVVFALFLCLACWSKRTASDPKEDKAIIESKTKSRIVVQLVFGDNWEEPKDLAILQLSPGGSFSTFDGLPVPNVKNLSGLFERKNDIKHPINLLIILTKERKTALRNLGFALNGLVNVAPSGTNAVIYVRLDDFESRL
jgi:hypothetical protein